MSEELNENIETEVTVEDADATEQTVEDTAIQADPEAEVKLETDTDARLKKVFKDDPDVVIDQDEADESDEDGDTTPDKKPAETPGAKDDSTPKSDDKDEDKDKGKDEDKDKGKKGLPEAYVRSANHQGWSDEEVENFFRADPEGSLKIFEKIHATNNKISQIYSDLGRQVLRPSKQEVSPAKGAAVEPEVKPLVDMEKIREQYEGDPLLEVIEGLNKAHAEQAAAIGELRKQPVLNNEPEVDPAAIEADNLIRQQIDNFWIGDSMKAYKDFYGEGSMNEVDLLKLTGEQQGRRWQVLEKADEIMAGAHTRGRDMDSQEALGMAHSLVSEPMREQIIRSELKEAVKTRSKGLMLAPSASKAVPSSAGPQTQKDLERKTAARLAKTFG